MWVTTLCQQFVMSIDYIYIVYCIAFFVCCSSPEPSSLPLDKPVEPSLDNFSLRQNILAHVCVRAHTHTNTHNTHTTHTYIHTHAYLQCILMCVLLFLLLYSLDLLHSSLSVDLELHFRENLATFLPKASIYSNDGKISTLDIP